MGWVLGLEERREAPRYLRGCYTGCIMVDVFGCGVDECFPELGTVDPGVRVPTFVFAATNQASLFWRDSLEWVRVVGDADGCKLLDQPYEFGLFEISGLLTRLGERRADVIVYCNRCAVKWSLWSDRECWMCGEIGYLYTPRNIRSLRRHTNH